MIEHPRALSMARMQAGIYTMETVCVRKIASAWAWQSLVGATSASNLPIRAGPFFSAGLELPPCPEAAFLISAPRSHAGWVNGGVSPD